MNIADLTITITNNAEKATTTLKEFRKTLTEVKGASDETAGSVASAGASFREVSGVEKLKASLKGVKAEAEKASKGLKTTAKDSSGLYNAFAKAHQIISNLMPNIVSQFGKLVRLKALRSVATQMLKGITEGTKNAYHWAKMMGNGFAETMDSLATSLNYMKNSIGAALAPLLNAIVPLLNQLIHAFVVAINYVNMFFAVLGGQSTYFVAKENAIEWGEAVENSAGGAKKAVEDLKRTILGFDEINQLQAPSDSGSGGGGGGGKGGQDFSDMFEERTIPNAKQLKAIFEDVLIVVGAIGAGILAWKISEAFGGSLSLLTALSATISIAGFVIETKAAYDFGKDPNLQSAIEAAVGAAVGILGALVAFGPASLMVTIPLSLLLFTVGFEQGQHQAFLEQLYATDMVYRSIVDGAAASRTEHEKYKASLVDTKSITEDYRTTLAKLKIAEDLLTDIEFLANKTDRTDSETGLLKQKVEQLNGLGLEGVTASFDTMTGSVDADYTSIRQVIDAMKELARQKAIDDLFTTALANQMADAIELERLSLERQQKEQELADYLAEHPYMQQFVDDPSMRYGIYQTGVKIYEEEFAFLDAYNAALEENTRQTEEATKSYELHTQILESTESALEGVYGATEANTEAVQKSEEANAGFFETINKFKPVLESNNTWLGKVSKASTTAKTSVSQLGTGVSQTASIFDKATLKSQNFATLTQAQMGKVATATKTELGTVNTELGNLGSNVSWSEVAKRFKAGIEIIDLKGKGATAKKDFETEINKTGTGFDAPTVRGRVDTKMTQQNWYSIGAGASAKISNGIGDTTLTSNQASLIYTAIKLKLLAQTFGDLGALIGQKIAGGIASGIGSSRITLGSPSLVGATMPTLGAPSPMLSSSGSSMSGGEETVQINVLMDSRRVAQANIKGQRQLNRQYNVMLSS